MNNLLFSGYTKPKRREFIHEARSQPPAAQQHATGDRTSPHYWNWAHHTASWPSQGGQPVRTRRVTWSKTILNKLEKGHFLRPFLLLNFIHWCRVTFVFIVYIDGMLNKRLKYVSIVVQRLTIMEGGKEDRWSTDYTAHLAGWDSPVPRIGG